MSDATEKRKYTQRKRAESQEQTRSRIVEAAIALHEELGPARTSISAVAERAGVQRLTFYRYFPDEAALLQACSSGWQLQHPPPPVPEVATPAQAQAALKALYGYFRGTQRMWAVLYRDVDLVPAMREPMREVSAYLATYAQALLAPWPARRRSRLLRATAALAVQFGTWRTLNEQGLKDTAMARIAASWIAATAGARG